MEKADARDQPVLLGIDLAWSDRARTGLAALDRSGALLDSTSCRSDQQLDAWLARWQPVVVAVDAPLVVTNPTGQRPCERDLSRDFRRYHAGCHPANLGRPWFRPPRGWALAQRHGWTVDPGHEPSVVAPVCLEVYPHPAMVSLFGLGRVLPYKARRGRDVASRRAAFLVLLGHLEAVPSLRLAHAPRWHVLRPEVEAAYRHVHLERVEDELDAILCAHLAWRWARDRTSMHVYGDVGAGFIVTPPPPDALPA